MNRPHVIFLNGPPRCGKDTVGRILTEAVAGARAVKLAEALKVGTHALFAGLRGKDGAREAAMERGPNVCDAFEPCKGDPHPYFFGLTPRQAYIEVSERLLKPVFGQPFFGQILASEMLKHPDVPLWAITDSGFTSEAEPIVNVFGCDRCTLVRLHRHGCDFSKDSRSYIDLDVQAKFDLNNNGTPEELAYLVRTAVLGAM